MRARTEARREAILETAASVFGEMGYERAPMSEIAARAGCSKVTLYGYFPSKEDLFLGVISHKMGLEVDPLLQELAAATHEDPARVLRQFGERCLAVTLTPEAIAMKRLIIAHMSAPELSKRFWILGPQRYIDAMESYLSAATKAGRLNVQDPKIAARQLAALYEAETNGGGLFAGGRVFTREYVKRIVARAIDAFMAMYGVN